MSSPDDSRYADARIPNEAQRRKLCHMMHCAFVEIRCITASEPQRAADLADVFHNIPHEIWEDYFSITYFREAFIEPYYRTWPELRSRDYRLMLDEVAALA